MSASEGSVSDTASVDSNVSSPSGNGWIDLSASNVNYDKVIFIDVLKSYLAQKDIVVCFQLTEGVNCQSNDYIGLFQVGFKDVGECLVKKLVEPSRIDVKMRSVVFAACELPEDESEFYQFLYMRGDNSICGASTPFQIGSASDDLIAEMSEDDFLIVRSQMKEESSSLKKNIEKLELLLTTERQNTGNLIADKENALKQSLDKVATLQKEKADIENEKNKIRAIKTTLEWENSAQKETIDNLKKNVEKLEETVAAKNRKLEEDLKVIMSYRRRLSHITNIKVKEGVEKCKIHEIEMTAQNHLLRQTLEEKDSQISALMESKKLAVTELNLRTAGFATTQSALAEKEKMVEDLTELHNKKMLEVEELKFTLSLLREDLNKKTLELQELQIKNSELMSAMDQEQSELQYLRKRKDDLETLVDKFEDVLKQDDSELRRYETEKVELQDHILEMEEEVQMAKKKIEDLETELSQAKEMAEKKPNNAESATIEDLKSRLLEAAEIFKQQYHEIKKLQLQVKELEGQKKKKLSVSSNVASSKLDNVVVKSKNEKSKTEYISDDEAGKSSPKSVNAPCPINDSDTGEHVGKSQCVPIVTKKAIKKEPTAEIQTVPEEQPSPSKNNLLSGLSQPVDDNSAKCSNKVIKEQTAAGVDLPPSVRYMCATSKREKLSSKARHIASKNMAKLSKNAAAKISAMPQVRESQYTSAHATQEHYLGAPYGVFPANARPINKDRHNPFMEYMTGDPLAGSTVVYKFLKPDYEQGMPLGERCDGPPPEYEAALPTAPNCLSNEEKWDMPSGSADSEVQYLPAVCPVCAQELVVHGDDSSWLWDHLEAVHKQKCCPLCGMLFDMMLPPQYFKYHVEGHFP